MSKYTDEEVGSIEVIDDISAEVREQWALPARPSPVALDAKTAALVVKHQIMSSAQLMDLPDPEWFIDGLIPEAPLTILHGKGGAKKTFLALDWMLCAAHGLDWHGHGVKPGKVLYIAAEGVRNLQYRLAAWAAQHDRDPRKLRIYWMPVIIDLFTIPVEAQDRWAALVKYLKVDYIVLDTLHRSMPGADENSSKDMGRGLAAAQRIQGDAKLIFLHHDPHEAGHGRGSSSIRDDADVVLALKEDSKLISTLTADKLKDADAFPKLTLNFAKHGAGISSSIYIASIGDRDAPIGPGQRILNLVNAEPGARTKNDICCAMGDGVQVREAFDSLALDKRIFSGVGQHREGGRLVPRTCWWPTHEDGAERIAVIEDNDDDA